MPKMCCVVGCSNSQTNNLNVTFHRFPNNEAKCSEWVSNLNLANDFKSKSCRVICSEHFHAKHFVTSIDGRQRLRTNARPKTPTDIVDGMENQETHVLPDRWQLVPKTEPQDEDDCRTPEPYDTEVGFRTKMEPEVIIDECDGDASRRTEVNGSADLSAAAERESDEESDPGTDQYVPHSADEIPKEPQGTDDPDGPRTCEWAKRSEKEQPTSCGRTFASVADLASHLRDEHHSEPDFACLWRGCKRDAVPFADRKALTRHLRTHSGEKPYPCPHDGCGKSFGQRTALRCHLSTHSGRKYACAYPGCGRVYSQKRSLTLHHEVRHTGERGYRCGEVACDRVFNDAASLRKHRRLRHTADKPYACGFACCNRSFASKAAHDEHFARHVSGYACPFEGCGRRCRDSWTLRVHERMHTGEKPYPCPRDGCGLSFATAVIRNTHVRRRHGLQDST